MDAKRPLRFETTLMGRKKIAGPIGGLIWAHQLFEGGNSTLGGSGGKKFIYGKREKIKSPGNSTQ